MTMIPRIVRHFRPNRVEAYLAAIIAICGALTPVVADLDLTSTAGIIAGVLAVVAIVAARVPGWAQYEKFIYTVQMQAEHEAKEQAAKAALAAQNVPSRQSTALKVPGRR